MTAVTLRRRRAEEELIRASAYNRRLIEASLDPLVTIGPDGDHHRRERGGKSP